jgi:hypothetical protein
MTRTLTWLGLGAGLMYYLDPDRGRSRRARARDRIRHAGKEIDHAIAITLHDVANRTDGLIARAEALFDSESAPDAVIVARVRSTLGRVVSHPHAVVVTARGGHVSLSGPVLAGELTRLLAAVTSVRGVSGVEDRLQVYERPGDHPALLGGKTPRPDGRSVWWQRPGSPTFRLVTGTGIAVVALRVARRWDWSSLALGAVGVGLVAHGLAHSQRRRCRAPEDFRSPIATGAPIHDVAIPFRRTRTELPETPQSDGGHIL